MAKIMGYVPDVYLYRLLLPWYIHSLSLEAIRRAGR
jgi:hypothetical protein